MASSQQATWSGRFLQSGRRNQSWLQICLFTTVRTKHSEDRRSWKTTGCERRGQERRVEENLITESLKNSFPPPYFSVELVPVFETGDLTDTPTDWLPGWLTEPIEWISYWLNGGIKWLSLWICGPTAHTQLSAACVCLDYEIIPHQSSFRPKICLHSNAKYRQTAKARSFISAIVWANAPSSTRRARQGLTFPVWLWMPCYGPLIKVIFQSKNQNYKVKFGGIYNDDKFFLLYFLRWPSFLIFKSPDGKIRLSTITKCKCCA